MRKYPFQIYGKNFLVTVAGLPMMRTLNNNFILEQHLAEISPYFRRKPVFHAHRSSLMDVKRIHQPHQVACVAGAAWSWSEHCMYGYIEPLSEALDNQLWQAYIDGTESEFQLSTHMSVASVVLPGGVDVVAHIIEAKALDFVREAGAGGKLISYDYFIKLENQK